MKNLPTFFNPNWFSVIGANPMVPWIFYEGLISELPDGFLVSKFFLILEEYIEEFNRD
jgi:hypothetical protein